jgi:hypothetical protein
VFPYKLIVQAKVCAMEGSCGEMWGMKLLGGLEYVLPLQEAFICEVIMVVAASPVMHRCPAIMTRDCKSLQLLMTPSRALWRATPREGLGCASSASWSGPSIDQGLRVLEVVDG